MDFSELDLDDFAQNQSGRPVQAATVSLSNDDMALLEHLRANPILAVHVIARDLEFKPDAALKFAEAFRGTTGAGISAIGRLLTALGPYVEVMTGDLKRIPEGLSAVHVKALSDASRLVRAVPTWAGHSIHEALKIGIVTEFVHLGGKIHAKSGEHKLVFCADIPIVEQNFQGSLPLITVRGSPDIEQIANIAEFGSHLKKFDTTSKKLVLKELGQLSAVTTCIAVPKAYRGPNGELSVEFRLRMATFWSRTMESLPVKVASKGPPEIAIALTSKITPGTVKAMTAPKLAILSECAAVVPPARSQWSMAECMALWKARGGVNLLVEALAVRETGQQHRSVAQHTGKLQSSWTRAGSQSWAYGVVEKQATAMRGPLSSNELPILAVGMGSKCHLYTFLSTTTRDVTYLDIAETTGIPKTAKSLVGDFMTYEEKREVYLFSDGYLPQKPAQKKGTGTQFTSWERCWPFVERGADLKVPIMTVKVTIPDVTEAASKRIEAVLRDYSIQGWSHGHSTHSGEHYLTLTRRSQPNDKPGVDVRGYQVGLAPLATWVIYSNYVRTTSLLMLTPPDWYAEGAVSACFPLQGEAPEIALRTPNPDAHHTDFKVSVDDLDLSTLSFAAGDAVWKNLGKNTKSKEEIFRQNFEAVAVHDRTEFEQPKPGLRFEGDAIDNAAMPPLEDPFEGRFSGLSEGVRGQVMGLIDKGLFTEAEMIEAIGGVDAGMIPLKDTDKTIEYLLSCDK